jgi:tight adherence protein C
MDMTVIIIGGAVLFGLLLIVGGVLLLRRSEGDALTDRINEYAAREELASIEDIELSLSLSDRLLVPMIRRVSALVTRFAPQEMLESTAKQLESGGKTISAATYWSIVLGAVLVFGIVFGLVGTRAETGNPIFFAMGGALFGFMIPRLWMTSAVTRRKDAVIKKLPDALDLMTICVDAGLTFDGAMTKVDEKWDDPLSREFGRVVYEIQLGKTRRQSLRDMSERIDVPDVQSFVASILQADQLGVSIGKVLRIQSEQMRMRRRQRAEEKAQQAPVKMLFPMVFLIFPALFVVLLGPAGFRVWRTFNTTPIN